MGRNVDDWHLLALALAVGLVCQAAPALVAAVLAAGVGMLHLRSDAAAAAHLRTLAILGAITLAGLLGGPAWMLAAALTWRVGAEIARTRDDGALLAHAAAPAAALLYRADAPVLLTLCAACLALLVWIDWAIEQLAAWRLDTRIASPFAASQLAIMAPLVALPSVGACVAGFVAMALARAASVRPRAAYAAA